MAPGMGPSLPLVGLMAALVTPDQGFISRRYRSSIVRWKVGKFSVETGLKKKIRGRSVEKYPCVRCMGEDNKWNGRKWASMNSLWSELFVEELSRLGVKHICIGPGSRSTPLTIAAAENINVTTSVHYDERSLGFYALGLAKGYNSPVAIVTTSGTAVPNLLPAVVEAYQDYVPLVVVSADRPAELLDCGANQAIYQTGMFSDFTVLSKDIPCPTSEIPPEFLLSTVDYVVSKAKSSRRPTHINFHFREPLSPPIDLSSTTFQHHLPSDTYLNSLQSWINSEKPLTSYVGAPIGGLSPNIVEQILERKTRAGNGRILLIAGNIDTQTDASSILSLARHWNVPLYTDICSQLRFIEDKSVNLVSDSDPESIQLAKDPNTLVIQFGDRFVSKSLATALSVGRPSIVQINPTLDRQDPMHLVELRVQADIAQACMSLAPSASLNSDVIHCVDEEVKSKDELACLESEASLVQWVCSKTSKESIIYLGNSMPIRYADRLATRCSRSPALVAASRGASGIDGLLSAALGIQKSTGKHVILLIGDLSLLHDIGALKLAKGHDISIILLNNDGGIIFQKLPVFQQKHVFKEFFQAPHGFSSFKNAAEQFGLQYQKLDSLHKLEKLQARLNLGSFTSGSLGPALFELHAPQ